MELVNFGHSVKDIPVPSEKKTRMIVVNSGGKFLKSMRWRVCHFLKMFKPTQKETYGFKTIRDPPAVPELKEFEDDFIELIKNIEFRKNNINKQQQKLKREKDMIEKETRVIVGADKTSNFYKVEPKDYKELVKKNVESEYKKRRI